MLINKMIERNLYFVIRPLATNPLIPALKEILLSKNLSVGIIHDFKFAMVPLTLTLGVMISESMDAEKDINERISKWFYQSLCNAMYSLTDAETSVSEWCRLMTECGVEYPSEKEALMRFRPSDLFRQILATCAANMLEESSRWPERHGYKIKIDVNPIDLGFVCQMARFHSPEYRYKYQQEWTDYPVPEVSSSRWSLLCKGTLNNIYWEHPWEHFVQKMFKCPILSEEENPQDRARQTVLPPRVLQ